MPPQPYKIRRCLNCRDKKKSCDLQRPECGRCLRSKHRCQGYDYEVRIVSDGKTRQKMLDLAAKTAAAAGPSLAIFAPTYRASLWAQFEGRFLGSSPGWVGHSYQWVSCMDDSMRQRTRAAALATTALPLMMVAEQQKDGRLLQDGLHMYSQAAGHLAQEMTTTTATASSPLSPKQRISSLVACLAMMNIEMMLLSDAASYTWLTHVSGIAGLLSRMNPAAFQDESHSLFLYCRANIVIVALHLEAPLFLADEAWMTIPFAHVKRDLHTRMYDVLVQLPSLLHQASSFAFEQGQGSQDKTQPSAEQRAAQEAKDEGGKAEEGEEGEAEEEEEGCRQLRRELLHSELIHRYSVVSQQLQAWHESLNDSWMSSKTRKPCSSWPGCAYAFASTGHAHVWTTYWMAQLGLHKVAARAYAASPWFALQVEKELGKACRAAESICASADYCLDHGQRGARAIMFYTMPIKMTIDFYRMLGMATEAESALVIAQRTMQAGLAVSKAIVAQIPSESYGATVFKKASS